MFRDLRAGDRVSVHGAGGHKQRRAGGVLVDSAEGRERKLVDSSENVVRFFSEQNRTSVSRSEVTIRDESGRAEVTSGGLGSGLKLERTGSF